MEAFVRDDRPLAYERLVERLLASPHYGQRWARHWLDVVHYGDSHGYDKDKPRNHAWPYRDYVVQALNDDRPYERFILEQLAGDVLFPDTVDGLTAGGFLAAGPWDFISHVEVPESKIDGQVARSLDRDDFVRTVMESFCSVTIAAARFIITSSIRHAGRLLRIAGGVCGRGSGRTPVRHRLRRGEHRATLL